MAFSVSGLLLQCSVRFLQNVPKYGLRAPVCTLITSTKMVVRRRPKRKPAGRGKRERKKVNLQLAFRLASASSFADHLSRFLFSFFVTQTNDAYDAPNEQRKRYAQRLLVYRVRGGVM